MRGLLVLMTFACTPDVIQHDGDELAPGVDADGGADMDTGSCDDTGLPGDASTSACPTLPPLCPEEAERERPNVELYQSMFDAEMRDDPWASGKESEIATQYPSPANDFGTVEVDQVECRTSVCVLTLLYQIDESGGLWFESRLAGDVLDYMVRAEPCAFNFPGRYTFAERSCGMFEHTIFLLCDR